MTIYDSTPRQVIRRQHHADTIAFEYPDLELAHLSRRISENLVTILEQNPIVPVRQNLGDHAFHLNAFFFGHPGPPQEFTEARHSPGCNRGGILRLTGRDATYVRFAALALLGD